MGDCVHTDIMIGGKLKRSDIPKLVEALKNEGAMNGDTHEPVDENTDFNESRYFYISECNYANIDNLKSVFNDLGLCYHQSWEAGGGFGEGQLQCLRDARGELEADGAESPMLTYRELKEASQDPSKLLSLFELCDWWEKQLPPLEIID